MIIKKININANKKQNENFNNCIAKEHIPNSKFIFENKLY